jgi:predicted RNase H-related nuclease YkuK (DUF458 family)
MHKKMDIESVKQFISEQSLSTKIYLGSDSERYNRKGLWYADYALVVVVHYDGCRGAKLFGEVITERDYDQNKHKPRFRLMNEVYKVSGLYLQLAESIGDRHFEIHLDINSDEKQGSNCVMAQAIGYIRATCNVIPMVKPNAFAASYGADRFKSIMGAKH